MRRRVQQILCGVLIAGTVLASQPLPVFAETDTETVVDTSEEEVKEDADYEIKVNEDNPDTATLVSCHSDATELKIPEYIDGKKITEIGDCAFSGCKNVTSLELPDSVEILGGYLFEVSGNSLVSLKLPANEIKEVKRASWKPPFSFWYEEDFGPFGGCSNLRNVEIPKGWTKVPAYLFEDCSGLENVEIPETVTELGERAFLGSKISYVVIPDSVKTIDYECFAGCPFKGAFGGRNLQLINEYDYKYWDDYCGGENPRATFGDGTGTFYGYKGSYLEGWTIDHADYEDHEWVTESKYSFVDLEEYEKDHKDYEIETNEEAPCTASIVKYNGNKTELKVPEFIDGKVITEIGDWAFRDCENITSLELPDSVEVLGFDLFDGYINGSNSNSLTSVKLPGKDIRVRSLPKYPITRDDLTPNYYFQNSDWGFEKSGPFCHCAKLKKVEIPEGWTKIPAYLFADCSGFENVVIPDNVRELGGSAFSNCNISAVVIPDYVKSIDADCFAGCPLKNVTGGKNLESITEYGSTFGDGTSVFYGYKGSYLEKWATENGYKFVVLEKGSAKISGRNLYLDGKLGAYVYVQVSEDILKDENAYATITVGDEKKKETLKWLRSTELNGEKTLILPVNVKARETNEPIGIQLFSGDGRFVPITNKNGKKLEDGYTFTVAETARFYVNAKSSSKKLKKLADAILNYGIYVQKFKNYKADNLVATDDLSDIKKSALKNYTIKKSGELNGVSLSSIQLSLLDKTILYVDFKISDPKKKLRYRFADDDYWYDVTKLGGGTGYLSIYTKAQELSKERELVISDGENEMRLKLSALSWSRAVLYGKNYSKETVDLAKMLYRYSSAADAYFEK
ncbi:MAG: leucine-rich repeat domain-containing protein [Eubacterium sp.]|nr:leucine-rich repeat domain-containing protein [Eubacterium sp.]